MYCVRRAMCPVTRDWALMPRTSCTGSCEKTRHAGFTPNTHAQSCLTFVATGPMLATSRALVAQDASLNASRDPDVTT